MNQTVLIVTSNNDAQLELAHREAKRIINEVLAPMFLTVPIDVDNMVSVLTYDFNGSPTSFMIGACYGMSEEEAEKKRSAIAQVADHLEFGDYKVNFTVIVIGQKPIVVNSYNGMEEL